MNSNPNDKTNEIKYIDYQVIISIISIIVIIISITLLYNEQAYLKTKKYIIPPKSARNLSIFNRSLALFTAIAFLYINYQLYTISKNENEDLKPYQFQISASILTTIAALIVLYVSATSSTENIPDVENPII